MRRKGNLGTREMAVLALVDEGPTHGYAIAGLLAEDGDLGRIWSLGRPLTYRTIDRLRDDKLIADGGVEVGQSAPDRKLLQTTAAGREAVARWLATPEPRIREFRPALLYKLELLRRRGADRRPLLRGGFRGRAGRLPRPGAHRGTGPARRAHDRRAAPLHCLRARAPQRERWVAEWREGELRWSYTCRGLTAG